MDKALNHLAIIPDGNRRWAKDRGLPTLEGHRKGFEAAHKIVKYAREAGIHTVTLWAFSTENWERTKEEVGYLMRLYAEMTDKFLAEAVKDKVKIVHIGRKDRIPDFLLEKVVNAENETRDFDSNILNIALDYGGRNEVLRAFEKAQSLELKVESLSEDNFNDLLDTAGQPYPNPDLIIRTSGEMRTSGFMIWQAAYAELLFLEKHFPEMDTQDIDDAIAEFNRRQRRFGK